jgi:hypothetical protein
VSSLASNVKFEDDESGHFPAVHCVIQVINYYAIRLETFVVIECAKVSRVSVQLKSV